MDTKSYQVQEGLLRNAESLKSLAVVIDELGTRLSPVLRNEQTVQESGKGKPEPILVPVATDLREHGDIILNLMGRIEDLIRRLEV